MTCFSAKQPVQCSICFENCDASRPKEKLHASEKGPIHTACRECIADFFRVCETSKICPVCNTAHIDLKQFSKTLQKTIAIIAKTIDRFGKENYEVMSREVRLSCEIDTAIAICDDKDRKLRGSGALFTCFATRRLKREKQRLMDKPLPRVV